MVCLCVGCGRVRVSGLCVRPPCVSSCDRQDSHSMLFFLLAVSEIESASLAEGAQLIKLGYPSNVASPSGKWIPFSTVSYVYGTSFVVHETEQQLVAAHQAVPRAPLTSRTTPRPPRLPDHFHRSPHPLLWAQIAFLDSRNRGIRLEAKFDAVTFFGMFNF